MDQAAGVCHKENTFTSDRMQLWERIVAGQSVAPGNVARPGVQHNSQRVRAAYMRPSTSNFPPPPPPPPPPAYAPPPLPPSEVNPLITSNTWPLPSSVPFRSNYVLYNGVLRHSVQASSADDLLDLSSTGVEEDDMDISD